MSTTSADVSAVLQALSALGGHADAGTRALISTLIREQQEALAQAHSELRQHQAFLARVVAAVGTPEKREDLAQELFAAQGWPKVAWAALPNRGYYRKQSDSVLSLVLGLPVPLGLVLTADSLLTPLA